MTPARHHTTNRPGIRALIACLVFGVGIYILVVMAAYHSQAAIIFKTGGLADTPPAGFPIATVSIPSDAGLHLNGWWLETPQAQQTVLYFQGNRRQAADHRQRLKTFGEMGFNALFFDYRGFGKTGGRIHSEADIYRDGLAAWDFLTRHQGIPARNIILWGRSLGGAVAVEIARGRKAGALVMESTFFALAEMARRHYRWLPTSTLLKFHFRNGEKLADVCTAVVVLHSPEDGYIPFEQGRRLYDAAAEPKVLIPTSGHHLELFDRHPRLRQQIRRHLDRLIGLPPVSISLP